MQGLLDFLKSLGAARLAAMGAVTLALIGFFAFLMVQMRQPVLVPLFTDLTVEDSSAIVKDLERQNIQYAIKNDGGIIMVPKDSVTRLRMKMAEAGLPKGGGVGYEIFDKSDALGATSFIQNINHLRALEGELARTIRSIERVQSARVHLVLPERPLFSRDKVEATASIVLKVRGQLEQQQVRAIRHLVASAVNGMKPERVSVIDEAGRLLADGAAQDNMVGGVTADERKTAFESRMRNQIEQIVGSVVGPGKARVQVSADFDMNRITETQDRFDPDGRVLRSSQTREEANESREGREGGQVSVGNELPGSNPNGTANNNGNTRDQSKKTEEIVNYEISRTTKTEVTEAGRLTRLSAAVLVDGRYTKNDKGEMVYEPRAKEEIDRIAALVRTAMGFNGTRGDQVEVVNLRFAENGTFSPNEDAGWAKYLTFTKDDIMGLAEKGVMLLLGLVVLLMVVRPLVRRVIAPDAAEQAKLAGRAGMAGVAGAIMGPNGVLIGANGAVLQAGDIGPDGNPISSITDKSGTNIAIVGTEDQVAISNRTSAMIDVAKVQGQVHAQSVQKVGELAEKNPHEAVSIIRSWLHEDAA